MSELVHSAKTARESLARGLGALQSDASVPPDLQDLAAPIAQAMGALHQIERSGGNALIPHAEAALNAVRSALSRLQAQPATHKAVNVAMEAVASSLTLIHTLNKAAISPPAANPAGFPAAAVPVAPPAPSPGYTPTLAHGGAQPDPFAAPAAPQHAPPAPAAAAPQAASAPDPGGLPLVDAALGAHSATNFYKGLSGNDIIDHGGLFVQTYKIPKIGAPVRLKVSLPGGYEFEANAVVRWSREQSDGGQDALPGFGAQFTQITPEARQLVYRYVRNREPLFHDDL